MKKTTLFLLGFCLIGLPVQAQLLDTLSATALQGQLAGESARGTKMAMNQIQQNNMIAQLNLLIMDIKTHGMGNYQNLRKDNFNYDFGPFDWNIGSINENQFFIELKNVDKSTCNKFLNAIKEASFVKINSIRKKDCDEKNDIQFVFD